LLVVFFAVHGNYSDYGRSWRTTSHLECHERRRKQKKRRRRRRRRIHWKVQAQCSTILHYSE
jgi:hypothetical protein